jgi:hypothetical protein
VDRVVQRLDGVPVASSHKQLRFGVIKTKRELPTQMREKREAILFVQVYGDLRVALATKLVAFGDQLLPDLIVPVELAIDHRMNIAFRVMKWLFGFWVQVDNSKAVMSKS